MARIIALVVIGILVWLLVRAFRRKSQATDLPPATSEKGENMVRCARCGVNLPASDTLEEGGKRVCRDNPNCKPAA